MKKVGYLITGLALGLTISVASPVVASTVKTISAKINSNVGIALNGEKVKLNTQPIEYNNLNYLPVGEISRALGLEVNFDKSKNTINITSSTTPSTTQSGVVAPENTNQPVKRASLNSEYKVGDIIEFTDATFKISKVSTNPDFNDNLQEITLDVEASVDKKPSGLLKIKVSNFINNEKSIEISGGGQASWHADGGDDIALSTPTNSKFVIYVPKGETLKRIKVTNPVDAWGYDTSNYQNPEETYIVF